MKKLLFILLITLPLFGQWTPASLSDVKMWVRTDSAIVSGDSVQQYYNLAGGTSNLVASAADTALREVSNRLYGRLSHKFTGTLNAYYKFSPDSVLQPVGPKPNFTVAFIARPNTSRSEVLAGQKNKPNIHFGFVSGTSRAEIQYQSGVSPYPIVIARGSTDLANDSMYFVVATHTPTEDVIYLNGVKESITYRSGAFEASLLGTGAAEYWTMGSYLQGTGREFTGRLYELLWIADTLTTAEIDSLEAYFQRKLPVETVNSASLSINATSGDSVRIANGPGNNTGGFTYYYEAKSAVGSETSGSQIHYIAYLDAAFNYFRIWTYNGGWGYRIGNGAGNVISIGGASDSIDATGEWEYVAIVSDRAATPDSINIYHVNSGTLLYRGAMGSTVMSTSPFYFGSTTLARPGLYDNHAYFEREIPLDTLLQFPGRDLSCYNPKFYYRFDDNLDDTAGNLATGTTASATFSGDVPFSEYSSCILNINQGSINRRNIIKLNSLKGLKP